MPDFTFCGGPKQAMSKLSFSFSTWIWFLGIPFQEKNRDEDWKKANSLFKQLFRCRCCPLIFLYLTTPTDPGLLVWVSYGQVATQNGWHFNDAVALRKFLHLRKWLCSFCSPGRKEWGRSNGRQFFVHYSAQTIKAIVFQIRNSCTEWCGRISSVDYRGQEYT